MYPNGANPPFQAMRPPQTWSNVNIPPITDPSQLFPLMIPPPSAMPPQPSAQALLQPMINFYQNTMPRVLASPLQPPLSLLTQQHHQSSQTTSFLPLAPQLSSQQSSIVVSSSSSLSPQFESNNKKFINTNRNHPYNNQNLKSKPVNNTNINNNNNKQQQQQTQKVFRFNKIVVNDNNNNNNNNNSNNNGNSNDLKQQQQIDNNNNKKTLNQQQNLKSNDVVAPTQLPSLLSLKLPTPSVSLLQQKPQQINNQPCIVHNVQINVNNRQPSVTAAAATTQHASIFPTLEDHQSNIVHNTTQINETQPKHKVISIENLLQRPGRDIRPARIVIILRGSPGSGKSYITSLIKVEEEKNGASKPKILSIDNYFICEHEKEGSNRSKQIVMEYEYDKEMDETYQRSLVKSFKKTVDDGLFEFIIVDMINEKLVYIEDMSNYAQSKGFHVYILEMMCDAATCTNRNIHSRSFKEIYEILNNWEPLPFYYTKLDVRSLLQDDAIENVEMSDACNENSNQDSNECCNKEVRNESENDHNEVNENDGNKSSDTEDDENAVHLKPTKSRWDSVEISEDKLNKLDGIKVSKKCCKIDSDAHPLTLEDYLEFKLNRDNNLIKENTKKKQVRWKDFEEEKKLVKLKEYGFVIGQTAEDWKKITGDYKTSEDALKTYKYI